MSGHFFFADRYFGYDDAIYATARLLEILRQARMEAPELRFSELLADLPRTFSTPEIRRPCPDSRKFQIVEALKASLSSGGGRLVIGELLPGGEFQDVMFIDGVRITFAHGWALVRASNTEPALIFRFEAERPDMLERYQSCMERLLAGLAEGSVVRAGDGS